MSKRILRKILESICFEIEEWRERERERAREREKAFNAFAQNSCSKAEKIFSLSLPLSLSLSLAHSFVERFPIVLFCTHLPTRMAMCVSLHGMHRCIGTYAHSAHIPNGHSANFHTNINAEALLYLLTHYLYTNSLVLSLLNTHTYCGYAYVCLHTTIHACSPSQAYSTSSCCRYVCVQFYAYPHWCILTATRRRTL